jgi:hypothetical protein
MFVVGPSPKNKFSFAHSITVAVEGQWAGYRTKEYITIIVHPAYIPVPLLLYGNKSLALNPMHE